MKRIVVFIAFVVIVFLAGCRENPLEDIDKSETANLYVRSEPRTASIFVDGVFTGKITPDSLLYLNAGSYDISLKLPGFADTTVSLILQSGDKKTVSIQLKESF